MKVVVDTNIIFSAILNSQSWIGQVLLKSDKSIKFYCPKYLQAEIFNHIEKIEKITKLPKNEIIELIEILYTRIHFLSEDFNLKAKLWTGDKKLISALLQKGFKKFVALDELRNKIIKKHS